ncbi:MAG TPA: hypothetical protein VJT49_26075 [Amycolatopsis sp.]|uniref:hypothetical protein n=1 Tax=Amycolatopsis sp. TaxID=37632 RepID=UPI002B486899|nr:hypothetical protein [Amycolatopsis sp.]HKS48516.1 hypothetical protein [Amycolatopsis sp.]
MNKIESAASQATANNFEPLTVPASGQPVACLYIFSFIYGGGRYAICGDNDENSDGVPSLNGLDQLSVEDIIAGR